MDNKFVLVPMSKNELEQFFDTTSLKVIHYFLKKSMISQPEKLPEQENIPIQIPKEHLEQWICQAIGAIPKGAGSYAIDVISKDNTWGADIKSLACKTDQYGNLTNSDSGETSLAQKFDDSNFGEGKTLDDLFSSKLFDVIWESWKVILRNKYNKVFDELHIKDIYYFFILRADLDFHLCGMKVHLKNIDCSVIDFNRSTDKSIWIKNYIKDEFGHVKIYKSKKRFELRLKPKYWIDNKMVITFNTHFSQIEADIRSMVKDRTLENHIKSNIIPVLINDD